MDMHTVIPKITEIKNIQDISKIIVLPLVAASYVLQTGLSLRLGGWEFGIPAEALTAGIVFWTLLIFAMKALFISAAAVLLYVALFCAHVWLMFCKVNFFPAVGLLFIALGFYGVLSEGAAGPLSIMHHSWFYTSFVVGFFLLHAISEFEERGFPPLFSAHID